MPTLAQIDQFRKLAKAKGFNESQISSSIAKRIQQEAQTSIAKPTTQQTMPQVSASTPTPPVRPAAKPGMSIPGLAANAVKDAVDFGINTPIQSAKSLFSAGLEGTRAAFIKNRSKDTEKISKQLREVTQQMKKEKDPAKKQALIQQSRDLSGQLEQTSAGLRQATDLQNPAMNQQELEAIPSSPLEVGKNVVKGLGASVGLKGENGSIKFDPKLALDNAYEHPVQTALMAKDVAGGLKGIFKGGAKDIVEEGAATAVKRELTPLKSTEEVLTNGGKKSVKQIERAAQEHLADANFTIPTKRAAKIRPAEVIKEIQADGFGKLRNMDDLQGVSDKITGDNGLITRISRQGVGDIKGEVKLLDDFNGVQNNPITQNVSDQLKISHDIPKDIRPDIQSEIQGLMDTSQGTLPDTYDPAKLYDIQRALEKKAVAADSKSTYLTKNLQAEATADVYRVAAGEIRRKIEEAAGKQGTVKSAITPEVIAEAEAISPRLAQKLQEAAKSGKIADVRKIAAPYAKLNEMIELTKASDMSSFNKLSNRMGGVAEQFGGAVAGIPGRVAGKVVDIATNNKAGRAVLNAGQDAIEGVAGKTGGLGGIREGIGNIVGKIPAVPTGTGAAMAASGSANGQLPEENVIDQTGGGGADVTTDQTTPNGDQMATYEQAGVAAPGTQEHPLFGDKTKQEVLLEALHSGLNQKQLAQVEEMYDKFAPPGEDQTQLSDQFLSNGTPTTRADKVWALEHPDKIPGKVKGPSTDGERRVARSATSGLKAVNQIDTFLQNNPSVLSGQGGAFNVHYLRGQEGRKYDSLIAQLKLAIKTIDTGADASGTLIKIYEDMLPANGDDASTIADKIDQLKGFLENSQTGSVSL